MKQIIFVLSAFILLGCNQNHKKDDLMGTWDWVSSTDLETGEVDFFDGDKYAEFVEIKSDSIYVWLDLDRHNDTPWRIEGDSIFLDDFNISLYIKELSQNALIVEYDYYGKTLFNLKKRKQ